MYFISIFLATVTLQLPYFTLAKDIVVTVGENNDTVFDPQVVNANVGDVVRFLFAKGNHSATQSTFALPCMPVHVTNETINGFDSGLRQGIDGPGQTDLVVPVGAANVHSTIWVFDSLPGSCGEGHIAAINVDNGSQENFEAAVRNAKRLNGTEASQTLSETRPTQTSTSGSDASSNSSSSGSADGSGSNSNSGDTLQIIAHLVASGVMAMLGGVLLSS